MSEISKVLAIETSCDDTSVAIVGADGEVLALSSVNQDLVHEPFGGIVPEIACRNHTLNLLPLVEKTMEKFGGSWDDIDALAVTSRPGLIGSLMVGVVTAKSLALAYQKPFIGVNHLEGHILAPFVRDKEYQPASGLDFPFVCLVVSGGHTSLYLVKDLGSYEILGETLDDAAGEAFDKFAKTIGLGFPGGVKVDRLAASGNAQRFDFPRSMLSGDNLDFSFSGLKTAGLRLVETMTEIQVQANLNDLCASYQQAIVDVLVSKLDTAVRLTGLNKAVVSGGVSANSQLRREAQLWAGKYEVGLMIPPLRYCTDNAAMIGYAGLLHLQKGERSSQRLGPLPRSLSEDFKRR